MWESSGILLDLAIGPAATVVGLVLNLCYNCSIYVYRENHMTLPDERYRSLVFAERLLMDLCDPAVTPRVPKTVRLRAAQALRHYPTSYHLDQLAACVPSVLDTHLEDTQRFMLKGLAQGEFFGKPVDKG